jgi:hypothetical protein
MLNAVILIVGDMNDGLCKKECGKKNLPHFKIVMPQQRSLLTIYGYAKPFYYVVNRIGDGV